MSNLKLASNADGRLEVFYTDNNHRIIHRWQTAKNNGWSPETRLGKTELASNLEVERNKDGKLEIFYVGVDGNFYHKVQTKAGSDLWDAETLLSQIQLEQFSIPFRLREYKIGKHTDGRLELFYISNTDFQLYHKRQTAINSTVWTAELPLPIFNKALCGRILVGQNKDGRLDLFSTALNTSVIFHRTQKGANSDQWNFETYFQNDLALEMVIGQNEDGRLELFYIGTNFGLYHKWQTRASDDTSWTAETRLGNQDEANQIALGQNEDKRLELFYIGTDNHIYHKWQVKKNGGWSAETRLSNADKAFAIAVGSNEDKRLEVFYWGVDGELYHTWQVIKNGNWSPTQQF